MKPAVADTAQSSEQLILSNVIDAGIDTDVKYDCVRCESKGMRAAMGPFVVRLCYDTVSEGVRTHSWAKPAPASHIYLDRRGGQTAARSAAAATARYSIRELLREN